MYVFLASGVFRRYFCVFATSFLNGKPVYFNFKPKENADDSDDMKDGEHEDIEDVLDNSSVDEILENHDEAADNCKMKEIISNAGLVKNFALA